VPARRGALLERTVLLAPDRVARAASTRARTPEERWMLRQPRAVRAAFVRQVLAAADPVRAREIWMLRQPDRVRESYVREVLGG
jgi:hypothetical protein